MTRSASHGQFTETSRYDATVRHSAGDARPSLGSQLDEDGSIVLIAERQNRIIGYVYAAVEPLSSKDLSDECGFIHDLLVDDAARGSGIGEALLDRALEWLREQGMPRVVLGTAAQNDRAKRLFERRGFRATMTEMTLEL